MTTTQSELAPHATTAEQTAADPHWLVAGGFLDALARRDFDGLAEYLDDEVRFRALIPPAQLELSGSAATVAKFRQWFGSAAEFAVLDAEIGQVGPRLSMRWRFWVRDEGVARIAEQHVFITIAARIVILDLLCSGFQQDGGAASCVRN